MVYSLTEPEDVIYICSAYGIVILTLNSLLVQMSSANENRVSASSNNSREKTYKKVNCFSLICSTIALL